MSFRSLVSSAKKGKKLMGAALAVALLVGGGFAAQGGKALLANVLGLNLDMVERPVDLKSTFKPNERFLASSGSALSLRKLVAVGHGDFEDADDSASAVVENGEEIKYLIHVGNRGTVAETDRDGNPYRDSDGNTWSAGAFVTIEDQFPADIVPLGRQVTCWSSDDENDTGADLSTRSGVVIWSECSYSEMSQRFFNAGTDIRPDTFTIYAPHYMHILVTGNYVRTPTLFAHAPEVKCNIVTVDGGSAFGRVEDSACVRVDHRLLIPAVIRTPQPDPSRPKPIPEPETEVLKDFPVDENLK